MVSLLELLLAVRQLVAHFPHCADAVSYTHLNLSLLRRLIRTDTLVMETAQADCAMKTEYAICYCKDKAGKTAEMCIRDREKVEQDTERDNFLSAQEAKEYGLIDEVITHR